MTDSMRLSTEPCGCHVIATIDRGRMATVVTINIAHCMKLHL